MRIVIGLTIMLVLSGCTTQFAVFGLPEQKTSTTKTVSQARAQCQTCRDHALAEYDKSVKQRDADLKVSDKRERDQIKHRCDNVDAEVVPLPTSVTVTASTTIPEPTTFEMLPESGTFKGTNAPNCVDGKGK